MEIQSVKTNQDQTERRQRKNKVLQKSACKTFYFGESFLFLCTRSINRKEIADTHTCKDLVAICFNRIEPRKEDTMKWS